MNGISPDPQKTNAILEMEKPKSPTEMQRFLGMVNQLSKFIPNIASLTKPLRELLAQRSHGVGAIFKIRLLRKSKWS